ncbi:Ig-like domain-containing protein [Hyalangium versicolor]|uniref:Ig-like domain-containing protein n=1 Tax=Hyalangium versicolor TaxID=2861190 RepID=UPI001CCDFEE8|nr:Ig-like domain-containing protein [Hyalangium versicolor]
MRRLSVLVLCAVCFALPLSTGCGGGDDPEPDAGTPPPPPPPPDAGPPDAGPKPDAGSVDLVRPTVLSFSPSDGETGVAPESFIEVSFSEAMQTDRGTIQIIPSTGLPNNGLFTARTQDWDLSKKKVTFQFPSGLPLKAKLTVNISSFADVAGNPMQGLVTFSFTVSDGMPPRVTAASPAEGAASVPTNTTQVSFTFNEPMDVTAGTLVPGSGLTLGEVSWTGNQVITGIITSALVYNANYTVKLNGFRNINGKALDGTQYLGDGTLNFGTGPDVTPPTVVSGSPTEGATGVLPENTQYVVITFSEPMDKTQGKADLYQNGTRTETLTPVWSSDGFNVTYDVQFKLSYSAAVRVVLTGFKDKSANALNGTPYLGDGALTFGTGADTVKPYVISSNPAEGEQIYPLEVYVTGGNPPTAWRKIFTFQFSEKMNASVTRVTLHESGSPYNSRILDGVWSADQRTLTVTVYPPAPNQLPLIDDYFGYYMDLTQLKDLAGNTLDPAVPVLGDGHLDFQTLPNFPLLNHACEHALTLTPIAIAATATYSASSPTTDQVHTRYELTLPSNGTSYTGYTKLQLPTLYSYTAFMDRDIDLTIADPAYPNSPIVVSKAAVRSPCTGITHRAIFQTPAATVLQVRSGPFSESKYRLIIENGY